MSQIDQIFQCGILTLSDKGARGQRLDTSGPQLKEQLSGGGPFVIRRQAIISDDLESIAATLRDWVDNDKLQLILTTGGTGVSPRDNTPEATRAVLEREVPGIAEAMRAESLTKTPHAMLSRGVAGIRKGCLIINLPGSERGARENLAVILTALPHAIAKICGCQVDCG
ncbi:MAG: MogA/MoaB family molybdenum cofactor biosynthesis protein [Thermodesulfobacteriota bacterium]